MRGELVVILFDGYQKAGSHVCVWDGKDMLGKNVSSGIYVYRLAAGLYSESRKMILIR